MAEERMQVVPSFSVLVETGEAGPGEGTERLDAFAAEHGVGAAVRDRLRTAAHAVIAVLAGPDAASQIVVEADIDQGTLQAVFTCELASRAAVEGARARLEGAGGPCDGFSVQRSGATGIEAWACFRLS